MRKGKGGRGIHRAEPVRAASPECGYGWAEGARMARRSLELPRAPDRDRGHAGHSAEVCIRGEDAEAVPDTKGGQQRIDGPGLDPPLPTSVPKDCRLHVIITVWMQEGECVETAQDSIPGPGTGEALQDLLKDQSRRNHQLAGFEGLPKGPYLGQVGRGIPAESQGPHACVHQKAHGFGRSVPLDRSPL